MTDRLIHYRGYEQGRFWILTLVDDLTGISATGVGRTWDVEGREKMQELLLEELKVKVGSA